MNDKMNAIYDAMWAKKSELIDLRIDQAHDEWLNWLFDAEQAKCDHKFVDRSHAGPESGDMDIECSKCGYYVSIPLY